MIRQSSNRIFHSILLSTGLMMAAAAPVASEGASRLKMSVKAGPGFNWMANGNGASERVTRARLNALRASLISSRDGATWICSPAGFGQRSRCHKG